MVPAAQVTGIDADVAPAGVGAARCELSPTATCFGAVSRSGSFSNRDRRVTMLDEEEDEMDVVKDVLKVVISSGILFAASRVWPPLERRIKSWWNPFSFV